MSQFVQVAPVAGAPSLSPLTAAEFTTSWLRSAHAKPESFGEVHALGAWMLSDAAVTGYGHILLDGELFDPPELVPEYVRRQISNGKIVPHAGLETTPTVVREPLVVFTGYGYRTYGHVLIEMIPRLWIASEAMKRPMADLLVALPLDAPDWLRRLLWLAGVRRMMVFDPAREHLRADLAIVPTQPIAMGFHPSCKLIFDEIKRAAGAPVDGAGRRLFITRRGAEVTWQRKLLNGEEIERIASQHGLEILRPEALSIEEQIRIFDTAALIVGEFGSGLHNAVYCRPDSVIGSVGVLNYYQSAIAGLCRLRQSYLDPEGSPDDAAGYSIDPTKFSRWLAELDAACEGA